MISFMLDEKDNMKKIYYKLEGSKDIWFHNKHSIGVVGEKHHSF